mmetsp:Transcript_28204/g.57203  ORF Transcript_28204/g.57203 Transcript_28204/m.57203 type:complete len:235 (-) Transcript_28204:809-1513(-)
MKLHHTLRLDCGTHSTTGMLVLLALLLTLTLRGLSADLLVVLLERGQILAGLRELALLHALSDVPVHKRALGVHQVKLVVEARKHLGHRRRVGDHAHRTLHFGQITAGHNRRGLVVDAALEARRAPVDKLDGALRLDRCDGRVHVLGHNVAAVHEAACHVLAVARITLGHHRRRLEGGIGDLGHRELLVVRLLRRDDGRVRGKHEVDTRVRHQVGLELRDVHVQGTVEAEGGRQ